MLTFFEVSFSPSSPKASADSPVHRSTARQAARMRDAVMCVSFEIESVSRDAEWLSRFRLVLIGFLTIRRSPSAPPFGIRADRERCAGRAREGEVAGRKGL